MQDTPDTLSSHPRPLLASPPASPPASSSSLKHVTIILARSMDVLPLLSGARLSELKCRKGSSGQTPRYSGTTHHSPVYSFVFANEYCSDQYNTQ